MYIADDNRYNNMQYARCGNSGILLPKISLGLWQNFGFEAPLSRSRDMILRAFDLGICHFDLANNYGPPAGSAEENFGKILSSDLKSYRDELVISTKAGYYMWPGPYGDNGSKKYLVSSLDQSLKRMGLDYVDIFYSHRPDTETPLEETMDALATVVRQGKALYVGISSYTAEQSQKAISILDGMGVKCLIHQPSYSMLNRWIEDGLQDVLTETGTGSIAFCPLAQGMLTNKYIKGIPANSRATFENTSLPSKFITDDMVAKLKKLDKIAQNRNQTLAQMALAWVLRDGKVTSALIGASSVAQIEENVKALDNFTFSDDELATIDIILK